MEVNGGISILHCLKVQLVRKLTEWFSVGNCHSVKIERLREIMLILLKFHSGGKKGKKFRQCQNISVFPGERANSPENGMDGE